MQQHTMDNAVSTLTLLVYCPGIVGEVFQNLVDTIRCFRELKIVKVKNRYERQYRRAVQNKDGHLARLILADMRKLYGMDKPEKLALTGGLAITRREEYEFVVKTSKKLKPEDRREIFSRLGAVESNGKKD